MSGDSNIDVGRVANIYAASTKRLGSGFLITDDLILTARHTLDTLSVGAGIYVRDIYDTAVSPNEAPPNAFVEWLAPDADIALLRAQDPSITFRTKMETRAAFGRIDKDGRERTCNGIGFPDALNMERRDNADYAFSGSVQLIVAKNRLLIQLRHRPQSHLSWKGLSGAAVFHSGHILGVIRQTAEQLGSDTLEAEPITKAFADADFREHVRGSRAPYAVPMVRNKVSDAVGLRIRSYCCLIGRDHQAEQVMDSVKKGEPRFPLVVGIPGPAEELHDRFVERLYLRELRDVFHYDMDVSAALPLLKLELDRDLKGVAHWLYDHLVQQNQTPSGFDPQSAPATLAQEASATAARKMIESRPTLCGFTVSIDRSEFSGLKAERFLRWLGQWNDVRRAGLNRPFVIFIGLIDPHPSNGGSQPGREGGRSNGGIWPMVKALFRGAVARSDALTWEDLHDRARDDSPLKTIDILPKLRSEDLHPFEIRLVDTLKQKSASEDLDGEISAVVDAARVELDSRFSMREFERKMTRILKARQLVLA